MTRLHRLKKARVAAQAMQLERVCAWQCESDTMTSVMPAAHLGSPEVHAAHVVLCTEDAWTR